MARDSRPPGFDMSYQPEEPRRFGPPLRECLPSYAYLALSCGFAAFIAYGHMAPVGSFAYHYVIASAHERPFSPFWFAAFVLSSGLAAVLRTHMRGVVVRPDGIEALDVSAVGWPKIRRFEWAMIDRFRFDASNKGVGIDLWNGTRESLPEVESREDLVRSLVFIAEARAIPYSGGPEGDIERPAGYRERA